MTNSDRVPFLKWPGGKRWLAPAIAQLLGNGQGRHIEPFVGSGACFFSSSATGALLADINPDLIAAFRTVKNDPSSLIQSLSRMRIDKKTYNRIRATRPPTNLRRAIRLLYLTRTAFNGLYRVNQKGDFNVPFGCKPTTRICDPSHIHACSRRLARATLAAQDFGVTLALVRDCDRVFIDPPYTVRHDNNCFRRYNECIFSWKDQQRLARLANSLASSGVKTIVTNAMHAEIRSLYDPSAFHAFRVTRATNMAACAEARGSCHELLLVSQSIYKSASDARETLNVHLAGRVVTTRLHHRLAEYLH